LRIDRFCELDGADTAGPRFLRKFAQRKQFCEISKDTNFKPSEPDALALTAKSNPVEAVVPIATSNEGQPMRTGGGGARDGASAMFKQRTLRLRSSRN
jgi:hypothetical protein